MLARRLSNTIYHWYIRRKTIRILSALDDRQLKDIGIARNEISTAVDNRLTPAACPDGRRSGFRIGRLLDLLREWHEQTRRRRELLEMPEYLLKDMGVRREDIHREIDRTFRIP